MTIQLAQKFQLPGGETIEGPLKPEIFGGQGITLGMILNRAIVFVFAFAGLGLLIMLMMAGFSYLTSAGDAKKLEQGKQRLTYAIVGFVIIFAAFWIVQIFGEMFGLETIKNAFR